MRLKRRKLLKDIMIFLIPILLCVGGYFVYDNYIKPKGIPSVNKLIKDKKNKGYSDKDQNKLNKDDYVNELPAFREQYGNPYIMGRLQIPNLNIDTLITRANNNEYYLNYSLTGEWDGLGVPFFDYRNVNLNEDRQINIYGHNTQKEEFYDRLPFTNLEAYMDKGIFDNYRDVYLSIDERMLEFEVVETKLITDGNNEHMKLLFSDDMDFMQHMTKLISNPIYTTEDASFTANDRVLVLQVCHYDPMGSYLLIICKEKKE